MFKKKCPICGAKNSKERTVCIECGAPFGLEQVKRELPQVSTEAEAQVKTEVDKASKEKIEEAPEKRVKDEYRDTEKVLYKTKAKISVPNKESEEVECFITESSLVVEAEEPIKIPLSRIKDCDIARTLPLVPVFPPVQEPLFCTATLTFLDDLNKEHKLPLEMDLRDGRHFYQAIQRQMVGRFFDEAAETPKKSALVEFFSGIKEDFRDKTRDNICAHLQTLGIDARIVPRGRLEEEIGGSDSLGIIAIREGPIRWVNVRKGSSGQGGTFYYTGYGVPDPRLEPNSPRVRIKTVRVKTSPLFGKVVDLRWEGRDSDLGIIGRLNSDAQLKQPIMESRDVTIEAVGDYGCWIISTETRDPSGELWNCYQTIACHLLGEWSTGHKLNIAPYFIAQRPIGDKVHNVCPRCGSSNINKAIKRMLKSRQEIEALGFKAEWYCLCFNCRCTWAEGEKQ